MHEVVRTPLPHQDSLSLSRRVGRFALLASLGLGLACAAQPALAQSATQTTAPPSPRPPLEIVKASMTRVLALAQSRPNGPAEGAQRQELRLVAEELFDFNEMSRLMLGAHWKEGTPEERAEFVKLLTDLLERSYLTALGHYPLTTITFDSETVSGPYAQVSSRIGGGRRGESSLEYRLLETNGRWAVYDVVVNGVSLVQSYRSQFNSILRSSRFPELLDRLRSREGNSTTRDDEGR